MPGRGGEFSAQLDSSSGDGFVRKPSGGGGALLSGGIVSAVVAARFAKDALKGITVQPNDAVPTG